MRHRIEFSRDRLPDILQCPTADYTIKRQDNYTRTHPQPAKTPPAHSNPFLLRQASYSIHRISTPPPAQQQFRHHNGDPNKEHTSDIHQHKCATTIFTSDIGETPYITETDSRSSCC
ncbi:hypothetical protein SPBRAN_1252 [uncultured Candidatus Thioglobus sp.]|nr:hypothetical protein SPBRAN_1252 [uncultured Candidatus Thioglobus sp.]